MSDTNDQEAATKIRVFISYARSDGRVAERLRDTLIGDGIDAYLDKQDIVIGEPWKRRLAGLIAGADAVAFLLSPASVASDICAWEVDKAEQLAKRVFPVICRETEDESIPGRLQRLNYAFLDNETRWRTDYPKLVAALRVDAAWVREHTRLGELAARWARAEHAKAHLLRRGAIVAAEAWIARRPPAAPALSDLMVAFLDASRTQESEDRDANRRLAQRGFVRPVRTSLAAGRYDAALRLAAAGALLSDDLDLSLEAEAEEPSRFALWRAASEAVLRAPSAILHGHDDMLSGVAFSPDGRRLLSWSHDGTARLWDLAAMTEHAVLRGHAGPLGAAAFSPDSARVLTTSEDGTARLWDATDGGEQIALLGHREEVRCAAFSPDGSHVATGGGALNHGKDNTARLWDAVDGRELAVLSGHQGYIDAIAFSPNGGRLVTGARDGTARLWDTLSGAEIAMLPCRGFGVEIVAFTGDGARILTAAQGTHNEKVPSVRLWDTLTGAELSSLPDHENWTEDAAISPDGSRIAIASRSAPPQLWDATSGIKIADLVAPEDLEIVAGTVAFSPDGALIATGGVDGVTRLWDGVSGTEVAVLNGHEAPVKDVAFSPDGFWIAAAGGSVAAAAQGSVIDPTVRIWCTAPLAPARELHGHDQPIWRVAISPDGGRALTASAEAVARLWDASSAREIAALPDHDAKTFGIAFNPGGSMILTGGGPGNSARLWDAATGALRCCLRGHGARVTDVAFGPDGTAVLTGAEDGTARLWSTADGSESAVLRGHDAALTSLAFDPNGALVLTGSKDKTARLWDLANGRTRALLAGHGDAITDTAFSSDGSEAITAAADGGVILWDAATGAQIAVVRPPDGDAAMVAISGDDTRILTGTDAVVAQLWARPKIAGADWREVAFIRDHLNFMGGMVHGQFSPNGRLVATANYFRDAVLISDATSGAKIAELAGHHGGVFDLAFSADGTRLVAGARGTARVWDLTRLQAFEGDRAVYLAAALDRGVGRRSPLERKDLLMQDAPEDLFAALMERLTPERRRRAIEVSRRLRAVYPDRRRGAWARAGGVRHHGN